MSSLLFSSLFEDHEDEITSFQRPRGEHSSSQNLNRPHCPERSSDNTMDGGPSVPIRIETLESCTNNCGPGFTDDSSEWTKKCQVKRHISEKISGPEMMDDIDQYHIDGRFNDRNRYSSHGESHSRDLARNVLAASRTPQSKRSSDHSSDAIDSPNAYKSVTSNAKNLTVMSMEYCKHGVSIQGAPEIFEDDDPLHTCIKAPPRCKEKFDHETKIVRTGTCRKAQLKIHPAIQNYDEPKSNFRERLKNHRKRAKAKKVTQRSAEQADWTRVKMRGHRSGQRRDPAYRQSPIHAANPENNFVRVERRGCTSAASLSTMPAVIPGAFAIPGIDRDSADESIIDNLEVGTMSDEIVAHSVSNDELERRRIAAAITRRLHEEVPMDLELDRPQRCTSDTDSAKAIVENTEESNQRHKVWQYCLALAVLISIVVIMIAVIKFGFMGRSKEGQNPVDQSNPNTTMFVSTNSPPMSIPTPAPTIEPTTSLQFQELIAIIGPDIASNVDDLLVFGSYQHQALSWLAEDDPIELDHTSIPKQMLIERYVLALLYFTTNGWSWNEQLGFLGPLSVCQWSKNIQEDGANSRIGVTCNGGSVTKLDLHGNNLLGSIPPELALLTNLNSHLKLNDNVLFGHIPTELASLSKLELLWLESNGLSGEIPSEIGVMQNLKSLWLSKNPLEGTIPPEIGNASNLLAMSIGECEFWGSIPTEIGNLKNLFYLRIVDTFLTGTIPTELGKLEYLTDLILYKNMLSGSLPTEFGQFNRLTYLNAFENKIEGSVPVEFEALSSLSSFHVSNNMITGDLDPIFCNSRETPWEGLSADCLGGFPEVICSCCTMCCSLSGTECEDN